MSPRKSFRPKRSGNRSSKGTIIAFLFLIVLVETFLLVRPYLKKWDLLHLQRPQRTITHILPPKPVPPLPPQVLPPPVRPSREKGMIAIIIDDNGYNSGDCENLSAIAHPITISILPDLEFTRQIAYCAHMEHKEIMLHLPLEPHKNIDRYPENYIIKTKMGDDVILAKLKEALDAVPQAQGVNNHMGSKATEDRRVMSLILHDLKSRGLFFIDSFVTTKTVCPTLAKEIHIPFGSRDVFLDDRKTRPYIESQFAILAKKASTKGKAIGIGHARALTWQIVREQLDKLSQEGFRIVTVTELIHSSSP